MLYLIIVLIIITEGLINYAGELAENKRIPYKQLGSLVVGIALAVITKPMLFNEVLKVQMNSTLDIVLTGFIISRGSNYFVDFIKTLFKYVFDVKSAFNDVGINMSYEEMGVPFPEPDQLMENLPDASLTEADILPNENIFEETGKIE